MKHRVDIYIFFQKKSPNFAEYLCVCTDLSWREGKCSLIYQIWFEKAK